MKDTKISMIYCDEAYKKEKNDKNMNAELGSV